MATVTAPTSAADVYASLNGSGSKPVAADDPGTADRFLKLLVAQMKNQDPLNPMDNAQVTTQMAQISTVDGINQLNDTVKGLNTQFAQLQVMQGAALLGREVATQGNRLELAGDGAAVTGIGGYDLSAAADQVRVEILDAGGRVVASDELGAQTAGRHDFTWTPDVPVTAKGLSFRVVATRGASDVPLQPLSFDRVTAVSTGGDKLQLSLQNGGTIAYSDVLLVRGGS